MTIRMIPKIVNHNAFERGQPAVVEIKNNYNQRWMIDVILILYKQFFGQIYFIFNIFYC